MKLIQDELFVQEIQLYIKKLDITPRCDEYDVNSRVRHSSYPSPCPIRVCGGASKVCLVFQGENFVIKWSTYDYGEAMKEVEVYEAASKTRLAQFFPVTEYFFSYNGIDFVIQEKVTTCPDDLSHKERTALEKCARTVPPRMVEKVRADMNRVRGGYRRNIDGLWISVVLSVYGKKATKSLCQFIQDFDINDLHGSNIGFSHGKPMILDFSGYHR